MAAHSLCEAFVAGICLMAERIFRCTWFAQRHPVRTRFPGAYWLWLIRTKLWPANMCWYWADAAYSQGYWDYCTPPAYW